MSDLADRELEGGVLEVSDAEVPVCVSVSAIDLAGSKRTDR